MNKSIENNQTKKVKISKIKKGTIQPIPPFKNLEEEADFWDTHSMVDQIDEGTLIGFHVANKNKTLTVRFNQKVIQDLRRQAFRRGIGPTTLIRVWVMEKLHSSPR